MKLDRQGQMRTHKRVDPYAALPVFREPRGVTFVQRALKVGYMSANAIITTLAAEKLIEPTPTDRAKYRLTEKGIERMGAT